MYKPLSFFLLFFGFFFIANINANAYPIPAITENFTINAPSSAKILYNGDLNLWDINFTPPAGQTIVSATLYVDNVYAIRNINNLLDVYLANYVSNPNTTFGLVEFGSNSQGSDWVGPEPNNNNSVNNELIGSYTDPNPAPNSISAIDPKTIEFNLADLAAFDTNGGFAIGFVPNSYFMDSGITLDITTSSGGVNPQGGGSPATPEPSTFALLGLGFMGLIRMKRKLA